MGSGTPLAHCHTVGKQWTIDHLLYTATLLGSNGQWISFSTLPHHWGAVGSGSPSVHCHTAIEQLALDLSQLSATLLGSNGQWITCTTLPQC